MRTPVPRTGSQRYILAKRVPQRVAVELHHSASLRAYPGSFEAQLILNGGHKSVIPAKRPRSDRDDRAVEVDDGHFKLLNYMGNFNFNFNFNFRD